MLVRIRVSICRALLEGSHQLFAAEVTTFTGGEVALAIAEHRSTPRGESRTAEAEVSASPRRSAPDLRVRLRDERGQEEPARPRL